MKFRLLLTIFLVSGAIKPVLASDADCAIWLCLPTGFPSGCGDAKSAFKKRIRNLKPPLPSLTSCLVSSGNSSSEGQMNSKSGRAAYIPERRVCVQYGGRDNSVCRQYETLPAHAIKNKRCTHHKDSPNTPLNCTTTIRYVETFMDGNKYGQTYYYDNKGNKISIPE